MSQSWNVTFKLDREVAWEGMLEAGRQHQTGWASVVSGLNFALIGIFAPVGLCLAVAILIRYFTGQFPDLPFWVLPVAILLLGFGCLWLSFYPWKRLARAVEETRFNRHSAAEISIKGFTMIAPNSRWHTGWADVEKVIGTDNTIVVVVSSLALIVPRAAFATLEDSAEALVAMQEWQAEATA